jgi:hypothetical protein
VSKDHQASASTATQKGGETDRSIPPTHRVIDQLTCPRNSSTNLAEFNATMQSRFAFLMDYLSGVAGLGSRPAESPVGLGLELLEPVNFGFANFFHADIM